MIRRTVAKAFGRALEFQGARPAATMGEELPLVKKVQRSFEDLHALFKDRIAKLGPSAGVAASRWSLSDIEARPQGLEFQVSFPGGACRWLCPMKSHFIQEMEVAGRRREPVLFTFQPDEEGLPQLVAKPLSARSLGYCFTSLAEIVQECLGGQDS